MKCLNSLRIIVVPVFVVFSWWSCGEQGTSECNASNCKGCCSNGVCIEETSESACGWNGTTCLPCESGRSCQLGQCIDTNDTCASGCTSGCCSSTGQCLSGDTDEACGTFGYDCMACQEGEVCESHQCRTGSVGCDGCDGCCANETTCLEGTEASACGSGGEACEECDDGDECNGGSCVSNPGACNVDTCSDGCCDNGICMVHDSQTDALCGTDGAQCEDCTSLNPTQVCNTEKHECETPDLPEDCKDCEGCCNSNGQCEVGTSDVACGKGGEMCKLCGGGEICVEQTCGTAPNEDSYEVYLQSAKIEDPLVNCLGELTCDPYAVITFGAGSYDGPTIDNDNEPVWNWKVFQATTSELMGNALEVKVFDNDGIAIDNTIGSCQFIIDATVLNAGTVTGPCKDCILCGVTEITFAFKKL